MVLSSSHNISTGSFGEVVYKSVEVDEGAWIASGAILYNCKIGRNSIVAAGAVVKNMTVPDNCMVEGNPAKIVAFFTAGKWRRVCNGKAV
jgi:acetyltransferase-like isoleucine patch superfamily enzyme